MKHNINRSYLCSEVFHALPNGLDVLIEDLGSDVSAPTSVLTSIKLRFAYGSQRTVEDRSSFMLLISI